MLISPIDQFEVYVDKLEGDPWFEYRLKQYLTEECLAGYLEISGDSQNISYDDTLLVDFVLTVTASPLFL